MVWHQQNSQCPRPAEIMGTSRFTWNRYSIRNGSLLLVVHTVCYILQCTVVQLCVNSGDGHVKTLQFSIAE